MVMMLRFVWMLLTWRSRGRLGVLDAGRLRFTVWPNDIDMNLHLNNGRYFSAADIGRMDWGMRSGVWRNAMRRGWRPMAGDSNARFSASLLPFQRYVLRTRLLGWNEKWLFQEHRFERGDRVLATVIVRYLFVSSRGPVPPAKVLEVTAGHREASPALPEWVLRWHEAQNQLSAALRAGSAVDRGG